MTELEQWIVDMFFVFGVFVVNLVMFGLVIACLAFSKVSSDFENSKASFIFLVLAAVLIIILCVVDYNARTLLIPFNP